METKSQKTNNIRTVKIVKRIPEQTRFLEKLEINKYRGTCRELLKCRVNDNLYYHYGSQRALYRLYQSNNVYAQSRELCWCTSEYLYVGVHRLFNIHHSEPTILSQLWVGEQPTIELFIRKIIDSTDLIVLLDRQDYTQWWYNGEKEPITLLKQAHEAVIFQSHLATVEQNHRKKAVPPMQQTRWRHVKR